MKKISVLVFILFLTVTGLALQNSTVDKTSEDKEIAKTNDPLKKALLHIKFANNRIHLIQGKGAKGKLKAKGKLEELYPLINEYRENIDKAYGEIMKAQDLGRDTSSSLNVISQATSKHIEVLNRVLGKVPKQAKSAIRHAIEVSQRGHQKAMENLSKHRKNQKKMSKTTGVGKGKALGKKKAKDHPSKGKEKKKKRT